MIAALLLLSGMSCLTYGKTRLNHKVRVGAGTCFLKGDNLELPAGGVPEPLYGDGEGGAEEAGEVAPL